MATLTQEELKQAVREWLEKRGIPVTDSASISIVTRHLTVLKPRRQAPMTPATLSTRRFVASFNSKKDHIDEVL